MGRTKVDVIHVVFFGTFSGRLRGGGSVLLVLGKFSVFLLVVLVQVGEALVFWEGEVFVLSSEELFEGGGALFGRIGVGGAGVWVHF